ncbi:MAG TPA: hypothetical protein VFJ12_05480 [Segeticoccus sp.]|nr:hypothetical protein [Segeticoccus sp.]
MIDLSGYTDDDLDALRVQVLTEQERRTRLTQIPATVTGLTETYVACGGDKTALTEAVQQAGTAPA